MPSMALSLSVWMVVFMSKIKKTLSSYFSTKFLISLTSNIEELRRI